MKIAIIGAGITGLGAALALSEQHDVRVFERDARIGGHANTVDVAFGDSVQPVDTGFIVYNYVNYPNLTALFEHLDVPTKWSDMSFGFSLNEGAHEYACDSLDKIFAQRWRAADPRYIGMLREILRFNKVAPADLQSGFLSGMSLADWLAERRFSTWFQERFLLPMGGAIWSTRLADMTTFPAESFVRFFVNHDLMTGLDAAQRWRTVDGGSREYVQRLMARLGPRVSVGAGVAEIDQHGPRPVIRLEEGSTDTFDQVIIATHGPQAMRLIKAPTDQQAAILGAFRTSTNTAILHSDPALMPKRRKVWSSWNFLANGDDDRPAPVSYWMNRLQGIDTDRPLFVSLNPVRTPDPALTHGTYSYDHPLFDTASFQAQRDISGIQGRGGLWYAGAWLGYGFHEDGLRAGLRVTEALGARPAWARETGDKLTMPVLHAAE